MTTQIAVKLPNDTVAAVDRLVSDGRFASRSEAVRAGLRLVIEAGASDTIDAAFARGFAREPETAGELADATRLAVEAIEQEPWTPWW